MDKDVLSPQAETFAADLLPVISVEPEDVSKETQTPVSETAKQTYVLIDNGRPNADQLVRALDRKLTEAEAVETLLVHKANLGLHVGEPLPPELFSELAAGADKGVIAIGSCGSCTARSVRDAADFFAAGVRVAVLVAPTFERQARALANSFKLPQELIHGLAIGGVSPDSDQSQDVMIEAMLSGWDAIDASISSED